MPLTIATWNVYHGTLAGVSPLQRMTNFAAYAWTFDNGNPVDLICYQEAPQAVITDPASMAALTAVGYSALTLPAEYPPSPPAPAPANNSSDGYIVLYNPARFAPYPVGAGLTFQNPGAFLSGVAQGRPPVGVSMRSLLTGNAVTIVNWHNEAGSPAVAAIVGLHNTYINAPGNIVIAGDFNVGAVAIQNPVFPGWNALYNGLDFVLTNSTAIQDMNAAAFVSDSHCAFCARLANIPC